MKIKINKNPTVSICIIVQMGSNVFQYLLLTADPAALAWDEDDECSSWSRYRRDSLMCNVLLICTMAPVLFVTGACAGRYYVLGHL